MVQGRHQTGIQVRNAAHLIIFARRNIILIRASSYYSWIVAPRGGTSCSKYSCALLKIVDGSQGGHQTGVQVRNADHLIFYFFARRDININSREFIRQLDRRTQRWHKLQ